MRLTFQRPTLLLFLFVLMLPFQNCTKTNTTDIQKNSSATRASGTGDGYGGMTVYSYRALNSPCSDIGTDGQPFPNAQILVDKRAAQLVRDNCNDLPPAAISATDFQVFSNGTLAYKGTSFKAQPLNEFEVAASACPTGRTPLAGITRQNLFAMPLNLAADPWGTVGGVSTVLDGVIAGLPSYRVTRTQDANAANWLRQDQFVNLDPNTQYAFSFFARSGSNKALRLMMYDSVPRVISGEISLDLYIGGVLNSSFQGLTQVSTSVRPLGQEGYFFTVYMTTPSFVRGLDIGFAADDLNTGASVLVTGPELEKVSSYCAP